MPGGLEPLDPNLLSGSRAPPSSTPVGFSGASFPPRCALPWYITPIESPLSAAAPDGFGTPGVVAADPSTPVAPVDSDSPGSAEEPAEVTAVASEPGPVPDGQDPPMNPTPRGVPRAVPEEEAPAVGTPGNVTEEGTPTTGAAPVAPKKGSGVATEEPGVVGMPADSAAGSPGAEVSTGEPLPAAEPLTSGFVGPDTKARRLLNMPTPLTGRIIDLGTAARRLLQLQADEPLPAGRDDPVFEETEDYALAPESGIPLAPAPFNPSADIATAPGAADEPFGAAASPMAADEPSGARFSGDSSSSGFAPVDTSNLPPIWAPPCPVAEVQAGNVTFRSDSLPAGTHEFTFLAIATSPGAFVAERCAGL
jgi:hypothetical protein